ncbi:MAG: ribonuclease P protein component [Gammaproteobacteria bacterium]|nr:MAG: ribonuclease P protein component [Gammaproteobacteria bacterium]
MTPLSSNVNYFPRHFRLITAGDYRQVFSKPKRVSTPDLLFLFTRNELPTSRLGLAIAKKQLPLAVDRNRIKRLVRESFRVKRLEINSLDIVVMARKGLLKMDNTQVRQQLDKLWSQTINKGKKL